MMSATVYLTLGTLLACIEVEKQTKIFLLGTAAFMVMLIGLSRIYLGVHYPTDVLAGWITGMVWSFSCFFIFFSILKP
jgi:undecaprenyl-diphosphatase